MNRPTTFYIFLLVITIIRFWYAGLLELSLDEAYYWVWAQYPSLSYYDHPPMVAWLIWLSTLLGEGERYVRLPAILSSTVITWLVYEMAVAIFKNRTTGFLAAITYTVVPIFALGGFVVTPDTPVMLFWTAAVWAGLRLVQTGRGGWWYGVGFFFGLALLSKYTAALLAPCLFLFLLLSEKSRHWIWRKEPYLGFALGIAIFTPVIVWNADHNWISFSFQLSHGFVPEQRDWLADFFNFWGLQIGIYGLFLFFSLVTAAFGLLMVGWREKRDDHLYLAMMAAPLFLFFFVNSLRTGMEGNWSTVAYLAAVVALPGWVALQPAGTGRRRTRFMCALLVSGALSFLILFQAVNPIIPMPQREEISRRLYGWSQLGVAAAEHLAPLGPEPFLLSDRYQITSLLAYYTPGRPDSYKVWGRRRFASLLDDKKAIGRNALYVVEAERAELEKVNAYFDRVVPVGGYRIERYGSLIREFRFFQCYNYRGGLTNG